MTQRTFTAVCFDMDGVLIQSREVIESAWTTVARKYGVEVDQAFVHEHIHGRPGGYTLQALFGQFEERERVAIKQQVDTLEELSDCSLVPGVAAFITLLDVSSAASWPCSSLRGSKNSFHESSSLPPGTRALS